MAGAEPFSHEGGSAGVLVVHGFTGNPQSLRPLAERLAQEGFSVELPLLPGHGTAVEDMVPTRWEDWTAATDAAFGLLAGRCSEVAVAGLSMGGTLACRLAERERSIRALVLVNPMVEPPAESYRDVLRGLLEAGTDVAPGIGSDIAKPGVTELAYPGSPLAPALSFFEGVDEVSTGLAEIRCPVLLFSSRQDHVVPSSSGDLLADRVTGPVSRVWLERSYHVATLDYEASEIEDRSASFLAGILSSGTDVPSRSAGSPTRSASAAGS